MNESNTDLLLDCVLGLLAPLLMAAGTISDTHLARLAAKQAIESYGAEGHAPLITAGQIVAFALTAMDNLRLSMDQDISVPVKLRLRGNASALSRTAHYHGETLREPHPARPAIKEIPLAAPRPEAVKPNAAEQQNRQDWATAMQATAADLQANAANTSQNQRQTDQLWIEVLTDVAKELRQPNTLIPRMSKVELLRSTLMSGDVDFPFAAITRSAAHPIPNTRKR
jgi:hypothetical protein